MCLAVICLCGYHNIFKSSMVDTLLIVAEGIMISGNLGYGPQSVEKIKVSSFFLRLTSLPVTKSWIPFSLLSFHFSCFKNIYV